MLEPQDRKLDDPHWGVVVGVDGSAHSKEALAWAARWARLTGEPLVAVAVWHYPAYGSPAYGLAVPTPEDFDPESLAKEMLEATVGEILGDEPLIELTTLVLSGRPAPALVELSKEATLVVVGSRGRGVALRALLGSTSDRLAHITSKPILIVR